MNTKPLYQQVKDNILTRIQSGALSVNDQAPSESEIVKEFGVSRMTANRALNELAKDGILKRIAGAGTFVSDRRAHSQLIALRDIAEELAASGHAHSMEVLKQEIVPANKESAAAFNILPDEKLTHAIVKHARDGEPILLEDRLVNHRLIPEYLNVDLKNATSYTHLIKLAPLQEVEHTIRAIAAPANVAALLEIPNSAPCLLTYRRTWSKGAVASIANLYHVGDRFEITGRFKPEQSK